VTAPTLASLADGVRKPRLEDLLALRARVSPRSPVAGSPGRAARTAPPGEHRALRAPAGRGLLYADSRPYQRGDDVRSIDWRVTARQGRPHTKVFEDEHQRPLWIVVDRSPGMDFGTRVAFKSVLAAQAAAWLAWGAAARGDRVGGLVVDAGTAWLSPARSGDAGVIALLAALCNGEGARDGRLSRHPVDALSGALALLAPLLRRGDQVVLVSDFSPFDSEPTGRALERSLAAIAGQCGLLLTQVADPLEIEAPPPGRYPVAANALAGGSAVEWIDTADPAVRAAWAAPYRARCAGVDAVARRAGVIRTRLSTDTAPYAALDAAFGQLR
jgi:uncharacterized protein (DUF58 family)